MKLLLISFSLLACRENKAVTPGIESDSVLDSDMDGLTDQEEEELGSDPNNPDSDGDGIIDGSDPDLVDKDSDMDGLTDREEEELGTDPNNPDTDGDGIIDGSDPDSVDQDEDWNWGEEPSTEPEDGIPVDPYFENVPSDEDIQTGDCCYEINMYDEFLDGWNGAYLVATTSTESAVFASQYGLEVDTAYVCADSGDTFSLQYESGNFDDENYYVVISPSGTELLSEGPYPQTGDVFSENVSCDPSQDPEDPAEEPSSEPGDEDLWDWGEPTYSDSFEGEFDTYFGLYNSVTNYSICEQNVIIDIDANQSLSQSISCTTSNGQVLSFDLDGVVSTYGSYPSSGYTYGYVQGDIDMTVPSGDVFSTSLEGECYTGSYQSLYLYWTQEVQTPTGTRTYSGYIYSGY